MHQKYLDSITTHLLKHKLIEDWDTIKCIEKDQTIDDGDYSISTCYEIYHEIYNDNKHYIAEFTLAKMPGCCGVVISTGAWIDYKYRRCGLGKLLNKIRIELAKDKGYSLLLCTDLIRNTPQRKILRKNKWLPLYRFTNRNTNNNLSLDCISLTGRTSRLSSRWIRIKEWWEWLKAFSKRSYRDGY